jgi:hypothetical protein
MVECLNWCLCRRVSRSGRVRVNPVSSTIAAILICQLSGIENHAIFDSLLTSCRRLHGQAVRYMPVYCKNAVVAVLRSWQSVYRYGVPHVIKGRHCSHVSSDCRNTIRKMVGLSSASSLMSSGLRETLRPQRPAPAVDALPGNKRESVSKVMPQRNSYATLYPYLRARVRARSWADCIASLGVLHVASQTSSRYDASPMKPVFE